MIGGCGEGGVVTMLTRVESPPPSPQVESM